MNSRTVYFAMVRHPTNGMQRVGNAYPSRNAAADWLSFVRGAWRGCSVRVALDAPGRRCYAVLSAHSLVCSMTRPMRGQSLGSARRGLNRGPSESTMGCSCGRSAISRK